MANKKYEINQKKKNKIKNLIKVASFSQLKSSAIALGLWVWRISFVAGFIGTRLEFFVITFVRSLFRDNIKIILLQESKIFSSFREFTFFHTFTNVPVDVCSLGVHHVVLLGKSFSEDSVDSNVVSNHDGISLSFSHVIIFL